MRTLSADCPKHTSLAAIYDTCGLHCPELPGFFLAKRQAGGLPIRDRRRFRDMKTAPVTDIEVSTAATRRSSWPTGAASSRAGYGQMIATAVLHMLWLATDYGSLQCSTPRYNAKGAASQREGALYRWLDARRRGDQRVRPVR